jgi:hypothetical protein
MVRGTLHPIDKESEDSDGNRWSVFLRVGRFDKPGGSEKNTEH